MGTAASLLYLVPAELLLLSGLSKLVDQEGFRGVLLMLGGLPRQLAPWLPPVISWSELALGSAVLAWPNTALRVLLTLCFLVLARYEYRMTQLGVASSCHCFGGLLHTRPSVWSLLMTVVAGIAPMLSLTMALSQSSVGMRLAWAAAAIPVSFIMLLVLNMPLWTGFWGVPRPASASAAPVKHSERG